MLEEIAKMAQLSPLWGMGLTEGTGGWIWGLTALNLFQIW